MIALPERLLSLRVNVELPDAPLSNLIGPCEILAQVGVNVWTLPAHGATELAEIRQVFSSRAVLGLSDVTAETLESAIEQHPAFVITRVEMSASALQKLNAAEIPVIQPGFTPTELVALAATSSGVAVWPAQALRADYAAALKPLLPTTPIIARGDFLAEAAVPWLKNGCDAVSVGSRFTSAGFGGKPGELRKAARALLIS